MPSRLLGAFLFAVSLVLCCQTTAQDDSGWWISPERINIQVGEDRPLQLLNESAQELQGLTWAVDNPNLAELREEQGRMVLYAKAAGTVRVSASWNSENRFREVTIWPADHPLPKGTTHWGMRPIGRDIDDLPAVPTDNGADIFSLEQNSNATYLRGTLNDGIQLWAWRLPENTRNVDLVFGDWSGGALISANKRQSFTLYDVGKDGKLRWQRSFAGARKSQANNHDRLIQVVSQSPDGNSTTFTALDETSGAQKFQLTVPASLYRQVHVERRQNDLVCGSKTIDMPIKTIPSKIFVGMDGFTYLAFTVSQWTMSAPACKPGELLTANDVDFSRENKLWLWQIHADGTYRSTIVEESKTARPFSVATDVASPTGALIPDGLGGELLSVRWDRMDGTQKLHNSPDELLYRIDAGGNVIYKFPLPQYDGKLQDDMVLGENNSGFLTRGSVLVAFSTETGKELWHWDSNTPEISVFAALADGSCAVKVGDSVLAVGEGQEPRLIAHGDVMINWQGQLFVKHKN